MSAPTDGVPLVTVKCVGCGAKKTIRADQEPAGGTPICDVCYMPMATVSVKVKRK